MKRKADWEEIWQGETHLASAPADRWAPWLALVAAVAVAAMGGL